VPPAKPRPGSTCSMPGTSRNSIRRVSARRWGWTEALTLLVSQTHAPDDVYEAVKAQFKPKEIVDLTLLISTINAWNRTRDRLPRRASGGRQAKGGVSSSSS